MQMLYLFLAVFVTALLGTFFHFLSPVLLLLSLLGFVYVFWQYKKKGFKPQSDTYKELEKLKKKREKTEENKHKHINDQVAYIAEVWGYSKEQEKTIDKFITQRAYSQMYNRLTASLFPQMITLIDYCNERGQKGCKREVSKRLRELTDLMKEELKKKKTKKSESYETTLEVYDQIMKGK
jgi:type III secretory pathway component EscV